MKKLIWLIAIALVMSFFAVGCDNSGTKETEANDNESKEQESLAPDIEASAENVDKLYVGMTYEETVSIMGVRHRSMSSSLHPFRFEWDLDDGSILYMVFAMEDAEDDSSNSDEEVSENGDREVETITKEQLEYWREKILNSKCVLAYIKKNGEIITQID